MTTRRDFISKTGLTIAGITLSGSGSLIAWPGSKADDFKSKRPEQSERNFTSKAVEKTIKETKAKIDNPKLAWMFENCFPNTLDTTVEYQTENQKPDTFVITGDIHAMWLRDSSAQVWPYLPLAPKDEKLQNMLAGVINRQKKCILIDPYANAFNKEPKEDGEWMDDLTDMKPELHERKYEIDSLCYPVRLAYNYWKTTGDTSVFDDKWQQAMKQVYKTFVEQQRKNGPGTYSFQRRTTRQLDTLSCEGYGRPLRPVGLINSSFRPSDDAATYGFLIPSNLFAVKSLKQIAEISRKVKGDNRFAQKCESLAKEVDYAIQKYGIVEHYKYGNVFAYEVDGFGNYTFMDDANVPSLLSLPYLGLVDKKHPVYQNTRNLIWSQDNPYFFRGKAGEGIGGPHIGYDMIWPMSLTMRALTSNNDTEIAYCLNTLIKTDADTGFMHETFHKDNPENFTRSWFAWANTLFGELVLRLVNNGKLSHLNIG